jgi:hypothetical protein
MVYRDLSHTRKSFSDQGKSGFQSRHNLINPEGCSAGIWLFGGFSIKTDFQKSSAF